MRFCASIMHMLRLGAVAVASLFACAQEKLLAHWPIRMLRRGDSKRAAAAAAPVASMQCWVSYLAVPNATTTL